MTLKYCVILVTILASCGQRNSLNNSQNKSIYSKPTEMETINFIYVLRLLPEYQNDKDWTEDTREIMSNHFNYLMKLKQDEQLILAGRTDYSLDDPSNFGIVIFNTEDSEFARQIMENDPAVKQKIMTSEMHPFSLALVKGE